MYTCTHIYVYVNRIDAVNDDDPPPSYEELLAAESAAPKKGMGCCGGCMATGHYRAWFFTSWMLFFFASYIICLMSINSICSCDCYWSFSSSCVEDDYTTCSGYDLECGFPCSMTYVLGGGL